MKAFTINYFSRPSTSTIIDSIQKHMSNALNGQKLEQTETGLAQQLADGVLLCAFLNSVRANSIHNVMKPASAHVNLSVTRARRNVESFVAACREIGVPEVCFKKHNAMIKFMISRTPFATQPIFLSEKTFLQLHEQSTISLKSLKHDILLPHNCQQ